MEMWSRALSKLIMSTQLFHNKLLRFLLNASNITMVWQQITQSHMPGNPDTVKRKSILNTLMAIFNSFIKPGSTKQVRLSDFKALTDLQCVISFLFFPLLCQVSNSICCCGSSCTNGDPTPVKKSCLCDSTHLNILVLQQQSVDRSGVLRKNSAV